MSTARNNVLSIAGFDPSAGAGILADIKTFEQNKVYGLGIISANTSQNDTTFIDVDWIPAEKIIEQTKIIYNRLRFDVVKIGLVENMTALLKIVNELKVLNTEIKIIWDPILKASAGFEFHKEIDPMLLNEICSKIYLITPNFPEALLLAKKEDEHASARAMSEHCHVYLKGGHSAEKTGKDFLFLKNGKHFPFRNKQINCSAKHGSGCILSAAIAANLARGFKLQPSCLRAKQYTARKLASNKSLLAYHHN